MRVYENGLIRTSQSGYGGAYRDCKWCHGEGCLQCETERRKAQAKILEPIFIAHFDNHAEMQVLKECFGREAIEHAFGPDGDGVREIKINLTLAKLTQHAETTGARE